MLGLINRRAVRRHEDGSVAIVGAGPGDPDLLTFKALRRLQEADVVLYDELVGAEIVDYARRDALRVDVGKSKGVWSAKPLASARPPCMSRSGSPGPCSDRTRVV